jgi:hypothetical protein
VTNYVWEYVLCKPVCVSHIPRSSTIQVDASQCSCKYKQSVGVRFLQDISISANNKRKLLLDVGSETYYIQQCAIVWPLNQCRFVKSSRPYTTDTESNLARTVDLCSRSGVFWREPLNGWEKKGGENAQIKERKKKETERERAKGKNGLCIR